MSRRGKEFDVFFRKSWRIDEFLDLHREFFRTLLGDLEFSLYGFNIDLGEALLEDFLAPKQ